MRPELGLFETAVRADDEGGGEASGAGCVLPAPLLGDAEEGVFAVGASLAQAALAGAVALDAVARLPPFLFEVLRRGPARVLQEDFASPGAALAALAQFDARKAADFRGMLTDDSAEELGFELKSWQGTSVAVTRANKADVFRRACEDVLVRCRFSALEALQRGFVAAGGRLVLAAMAEAGVPTLRPLVFDAGARERRRAAAAAASAADAARRAAEDAASAAFVSATSKPCPGCGVLSHRYTACTYRGPIICPHHPPSTTKH